MFRSHASLLATLAIVASPLSSVAGIYAPPYGGSGGGSLTTTDGTNSVAGTTTMAFGKGFVVGGSAGSATVDQTFPIGTDRSGAGGAIAASDAGTTVPIGAFAYTLPQAGSAGFEAGWGACLANVGAGNATVSTTTSIFKGGSGTSSITVRPGDQVCPNSDGTNYLANPVFNNIGRTANAPIIGAGAGAGLGEGTRSGSTTTFVTKDASSPAADDCAKWDASGNLTTTGAACGGAGGTPGGTAGAIQYNNAGVFGGAVITGLVKGNGASAPAAAVAGTDYVASESDPVVKAINGLVKSNGTTISAATAGTDYAAAPGGAINTPLFNNGAGGFTSGTRSGNTTAVVTKDASAPVANDCAKWDASGNLTTAGAACGGASSLTTTDGTTSVPSTTTQTFGTGFKVGGSAGSATIDLSNVTNTQSAASYTLATTDKNKSVWMTNAAATTVTVLAATTAGGDYGTTVTCDAGCTLNRSGADTFLGGTTSVAVAAKQTAYLTSDGTSVWRVSILPATDPSNAGNLLSGTVAAARGGAGTVNGLMKANGSGAVSAAVAGTDYAAAPGGAANTPVFADGSGGFTAGTRSGNTTAVVTTTGTQTSGRCVEIDASGNHVAAAAGCGGSSAAVLQFSTAGINYTTALTFFGDGTPSSSHGAAAPLTVPYAGTVSGLICTTNAAPGSGVTHTFTLSRVTGGGAAADDTNQQATISGTTATQSTTVNDVGIAVLRGDTLTVHVAISSGTPSVRATCSLKIA